MKDKTRDTVLEQIKTQVQLLTSPIRNAFWQDPEVEGDQRVLRTTFAPSLLDQLDASIGSGGGTGAGGVGEKRTRNILDSAAVELLTEIKAGIGSLWTEEYRGRDRKIYTIPPKILLNDWFRLYARRVTREGFVPEEHEGQRQLRILRGWVNSIESKFDPPRKIELMVQCPGLVEVDGLWHDCQERFYFDAAGDRSSAVVASVTSGGQVYISCKVCKSSWHGSRELEELGRALGLDVAAALTALAAEDDENRLAAEAGAQNGPA